MNNFSPNMLKTFEECRMKFFFKYVEKLSVPQSSRFFEKGKKVHALANYCLRGNDVSKMEKVLTPDERSAWENLKASPYFNFEFVNSEYNLSCRVGSWWVGGRLDALVKNDDDYYILDYKTGKIPANAEFDFQTIVYLLSVDKLLKSKKINCASLRFVYLGLKNNEEKSILLTEDLKQKYEEKVIAACKNIDLALSSTVFAKNAEACASCEYSKLCGV